MNIIGIIPARMGSSRFPGKPLAKICGIPMIGHVYLRSRLCNILDNVYVATCDKVIAKYINSIGAEAIMTSKIHKRASDRVAEALLKIERKTKQKADIVVMIQGDEPMVYPSMIKEAVRTMLKDKSIQAANLMSPLKSSLELEDANTIKVVVDKDNFALYFSREPIPSGKKTSAHPQAYKQICVIPFKRDFLLKFKGLYPTPLEIAESIDMLRIIEHGFKVKMVSTRLETHSVDSLADLRIVEGLMKKDPLFSRYVLKGKS